MAIKKTLNLLLSGKKTSMFTCQILCWNLKAKVNLCYCVLAMMGYSSDYLFLGHLTSCGVEFLTIGNRRQLCGPGAGKISAGRVRHNTAPPSLSSGSLGEADIVLSRLSFENKEVLRLTHCPALLFDAVAKWAICTQTQLY